MTAKRRPKGSGSIYVLKDGTVVGRYEVETPSGETKRKYVRGKTKREVAAKLAKAIAERDAGIVYDSEGLTVERYLVEHWLESIRDKVRPGTYNAEDGLGDTIRPRLEAAGADLTKVLALSPMKDDDNIISIPTDIPLIEKAIERVGARLLIIDPLSAFMRGDPNK
jgi:AAA domain